MSDYEFTDKELFEHIAKLEDLFQQLLAENFTASDLFYATGLPQSEIYQLYNLLNLITIDGEEHEQS